MTDNIAAWWARRQFSKGVDVPYAVGTFRNDWQRYPALVRQYHPDLNGFISLTQIPPAADVYVTWQCDVGHTFVATPDEQRTRPGRTRRRSAWCPDCSAGALRRRIPDARPSAPPRDSAAQRHPAPPRDPAAQRLPAPPRDPAALRDPAIPGGLAAPRLGSADLAPAAARRVQRAAVPPGRAVGEAFHSERAPAPASAAEARLRQLLAQRFEFDDTLNALWVARPFFGRYEVWPDILLPDLRVAIEYDTIGRFGLEHVGDREAADRRKDRLVRAAHWEVVRIRCGALQPLGPHDLLASSAVTPKLADRLIDTLRALRGDLIVNAYLADR